MLLPLFQAVDNRDAAAFAGFLSDDCTFIFGNQPAVAGRDAIREFVGGFFGSIEALSHQLDEYWDVPGGIVCHGRVTYTRRDGSQLTVPFANILKLRNGQICDYRIFADTSDLYR